jgi:transcriptional regulator with XRE-family HTH domain
MSVSHPVEARSELSDKVFSRVLGEELRRAREAHGWSRAQFIALLPSGISERTLLAYEHGLRRLTTLRLIELCHPLRVDAPSLLGRALQRAQIHLETLPLTIDLHALLNDWSPTYRPLAQWAQNTLNEHPDGTVEITPEVVRNLALFMGRTNEQLATYLARFLPEVSEVAGRPGACGTRRMTRSLPEACGYS